MVENSQLVGIFLQMWMCGHHLFTGHGRPEATDLLAHTLLTSQRLIVMQWSRAEWRCGVGRRLHFHRSVRMRLKLPRRCTRN